MTVAYIGIGSNLGDRQWYITRAIEALKDTSAIRLTKSSSIYETEPVSDVPQGAFLNGVLEIETELSVRALMNRLKEIEKELGRTRDIVSGPRTVDLDILFFGGDVIEESDLIVPHPRLHERFFVLSGLNEISSNFVHPILKTKVKDLYESLKIDAKVS